MDGRSLDPRTLALGGLRALVLITLALLLVFVYAFSGRAEPQSEEVPDTKPNSKAFVEVQMIPALTLVTRAAPPVAAPQAASQVGSNESGERDGAPPASRTALRVSPPASTPA